MTAAVDFDHTSFAVRDAMSWARRLRAGLGATPIAGEVLAEFRYLLLYVGTTEGGGCLELLEPVGSGFLSRFLDKRGEGPHHVTFTVPDLRSTVADLRSIGVTVVGVDDTHAPWREAFVAPDDRLGVVIQVAQSDRAYPPPSALLASRDRDTSAFPSSRGATDPHWWTALWETAPGPAVVLGDTYLGVTDPGYARQLLEGVLGGERQETGRGIRYAWPAGALVVEAAARPGVIGVGLRGRARSGVLPIGPAWIGPPR